MVETVETFIPRKLNSNSTSKLSLDEKNTGRGPKNLNCCN